MKKHFLFLVAALVFSTTLFAQQKDSTPKAENSTLEAKPISVNFGLNFAVPMGEFGDFASMGVGGDVTFEYPFSSILIGTAKVGYISFGGEELDLGSFGKFKYTTSAVPIIAGVKIFLSEKKDFYAIVNAGLHIFTVSTSIINPVSKVTTEDSESSLEGGFGIGGGYLYPVSEKIHLDANIKYQYGTEDTSYLNVRGGIRFTL